MSCQQRKPNCVAAKLTNDMWKRGPNLRLPQTLAFIFMGLSFATSVLSASSNCTDAQADVELAICASPELSALDELIVAEYKQLDRRGRYFEATKSNQTSWIKSTERLADGVSFNVQLGYLKFINAFTKCLFNVDGTTNDFDACEADIRSDELEECRAKESSNLGMTICMRSYIEALTTIEGVETNLSGVNNVQVWQAYRESECNFISQRYLGGTIASLVFSDCWVSLTSQRIKWIFSY